MKEGIMGSIVEGSLLLLAAAIIGLLLLFLISPNTFVEDASFLFKAWKDEWKEFLERFRK